MKRLQRQKLEGDLVQVSDVLPALNKLLEGLAGILKRSALSDAEKDDIASMIRDFGRRWVEEHEPTA